MAKQTTIRVDYENNAETWWTRAQIAYARCPMPCRSLLDIGVDEMTVSSDDAEAFR